MMDKAVMIEEGRLTGVIKSDGVLKGSMAAPAEIVTGAETFDVTITSSTDSSGNVTYTPSDIFDDILAAALDNIQVRLITPDNKYCLLGYIPDSGTRALFFNEDPVFANDGSYISGGYWTIYSNNKVDRSDEFMVKGLPSYSTDEDDGKVLQVSATNGVNWATPAVAKIESLDESNIKTLRGLEDGPYVLSGYFAPYTGADSTLIFDPPAIVSISSTDSTTHVQILEPYNNQIQHLAITDTTCETTYISLNDIAKSASEIGDLSILTTTAKDTLVDAINDAASAVTFTVDAYVGMEKTDITVDKTPAEIYEAYTKGLIVTLNLRSDTQNVLLQKVNLKLSSIKKSNDEYEIVFSNLVKGGIPISYALYWNGIRWKYERDYIADYDYLEQNYAKCYYGTDSVGKILGIDSYGIVVTMDAAGSVIPSVTASDNGKVLQVVDGAWAAVTASGGSGDSITVIEF